MIYSTVTSVTHIKMETGDDLILEKLKIEEMAKNYNLIHIKFDNIFSLNSFLFIYLFLN